MADQSSSIRVRRPRGLEKLTLEGEPFSTMRDALVFCAALGWKSERRASVEGNGEGEPIRWEVMVNHRGTEPLMNMIALAIDGDLNILSSERFPERVLLFEEFGAGGIEIITAELDRNPTMSLTQVVRGLVQKQQSDSLEEEIITLASSNLDL